jgi:hypothetical protein
MESEFSALTIKRAMRLHKQKTKAGTGMKGAGQGGPATSPGQVVARYLIHHWHSFWRMVRRQWRMASAAARKHIPVRSESVEQMKSEYVELRDQLNLLAARLQGLEERERPTLPVRGELSLNLTSKSMALKLWKNGEDPRQIARILDVPVGEIQLLVKVQRLRAQVTRQEKNQALEWKRPVEATPAETCERIESGAEAPDWVTEQMA